MDAQPPQFTPRAQQTLALARQEAVRLNHNFVGTEHVLLGLIGQGQGVAVTVLQRLGLDLENVRQQVGKEIRGGAVPNIGGNIPYTPRMRKVLLLAAKEAKALNHLYVGTEHILLGLLREGDGVAGKVLKNLGLDLKLCQQEILKELDPNYQPNQREVAPASPVPSKPPEKDPQVLAHDKMDEFRPQFTPRAQQILAYAREEADRFNHNFVGTEHVLLGLIRLGQGVATNVLLRLGLDLENVRQQVEKEARAGAVARIGEAIPYTPRVKKVLMLAVKEAKALNHTYVGTEHILLGLLREGDGVAGKVLKNLGVDLKVCRQEILKELDPNYQPNQVDTAPDPRVPNESLEKDPMVRAHEPWWRAWLEWLRR